MKGDVHMNIKIISFLVCLLISGGCIIGGTLPDSDCTPPSADSSILSSLPQTDSCVSSEPSAVPPQSDFADSVEPSEPSEPNVSKPASSEPESSKPSEGAPESDKPAESEAPSKPVSSQPTPSKPESSSSSESAAPSRPDSSSGGESQSNSEYKKAVFDLVNEQRKANGLSALAYRDDVQKAADIRAKEIITNFSHTRPNGTSCFTALKETGVSYRSAGENIAYGQRSPQAVMTAWMNSSGHRANILSSNFTGMAVGHVNYGGVNYWVQLFVK